MRKKCTDDLEVSMWIRGVTLSITIMALACALASGNYCYADDLLPLRLDKVRTWAYQIQSLSADGALGDLAGSDYDMLVVDPTRTDWSSDDRNFDTASAIARLKKTPASDGKHRKIILAYIDIGQAEEWRWYWSWGKTKKALPEFIATPDPDGWDGNFVVGYWREGWKDILLHGRNTPPSSGRDYVSIMDEVLQSGFDGVYLDWVEAYESPEVLAMASEDGVDAPDEMVQLIGEIREYGRAKNPDFVVIQQNGALLGKMRPAVLEVVDGIAQEEVWYGGIATDDWDEAQGYDSPIDPGLTAEYLDSLQLYQRAGITVFNVEYALEMAPAAYESSYAKGYVPYCTRRSLGRLTTTPPPAP